MAHTFGATILSRTSAATSPITRSATTTASDTVLVLMLNTVGATDRAGGAPTFNGVAGVQANSTQKAAASPEAGVEVWYWVGGIRSGAGALFIGTANIVIPNTGSLTIFSAAYSGRAASGFTSLFDAANGTNATSANPTTNAIVSTLNGAIYFASTAGGWQSFAPSARTGTSLYETDDGANGGGGQYLLQTSAGSQAMTWTQASDDWGAVGVAFRETPKPEPAAGALTLTGTVSALAFTLGMAAGALAFTGHVPTVAVTTPIDITAGSLAFTGQPPTAVIDVPIAVPTGSLSLTGQTPTLTVSSAGIALVASIAQGQAASNPSTSAIDTTGANLLVVAVHTYGETAVGTLSDSKGNTWTALTDRLSSDTTVRCRLYYATNGPTVGSGHTVTLTDSDAFGVVSLAAFSGAHQTAPFDTENGAGAIDSSIQAGSVTPSQNGSLLFAALAWGPVSRTVSIDSGFATPVTTDGTGPSLRGGSVAYLVQGTAAASNPTWSWTGGITQAAAAIAVFKPDDPNKIREISAGSLVLTGYAPTVQVAVGPTAIEIAAGALSLTGYAPSANSGTLIEIGAGSLIFKGPQRPVGSVSIPVGAGSLTFTGYAPSIFSGSLIEVSAGSLTLEGQFVGIAFAGPEPGALNLIGYAPVLTFFGQTVIVPDVGVLELEGHAPTLLQQHLATPDVGSLSLVGQTPTAFIEQFISPAAGALTLTGQTPTLTQQETLGMASGSLTLTGTVPVLSHTLPIAAGSLTLSGQAPSLFEQLAIAIDAGSLEIDGYALSLVGQGVRSPDPAVLTFTGYASALGLTFPIAAGSLTLAGQAPTLSAGSEIAIASGSLAFTGYAPTLSLAGTSSPATAVLTLAGHAPQVVLFVTVPVASGTLTLTGQAPSLTEDIGRQIPAGELTLRGAQPTLRLDLVLALDTGALTIAGYVPELQLGDNRFFPDEAVLILQGYAPGANISLEVTADVTVIARAVPRTIIVSQEATTTDVDEEPFTLVVP